MGHSSLLSLFNVDQLVGIFRSLGFCRGHKVPMGGIRALDSSPLGWFA